MEKIAQDLRVLYEIIAKRNNVYVWILIIGLAISIASTCLLIADCAIVEQKKNILLYTHWITANTGLEAYDVLDYDGKPVEVKWHVSAKAPKRWVTLRSEDTQYDGGRPIKSVVHITCRPQVRKAIASIQGLDTTLSLAVIIISFGNIFVANIGLIIFYTHIYDAALVAALAANSLLIIGPTLLASIYVGTTRYNIFKIKQPTMIEINAATRMSSSKRPQRMHPIWPLCWIATEYHEDLSNLWATFDELRSKINEWSCDDKDSVFEQIVRSSTECKEYRAISMSNLRNMCISKDWMNKLDELVVNTYAKREVLTNDFVKNNTIGYVSTQRDIWLSFSSMEGVNAIRWKNEFLNTNRKYYLFIGRFGQRALELSPTISADNISQDIEIINTTATTAIDKISKSIYSVTCESVVNTEMCNFVNVVNSSHCAPEPVIVASNRAIEQFNNATNIPTSTHANDMLQKLLDITQECTKHYK